MFPSRHLLAPQNQRNGIGIMGKPWTSPKDCLGWIGPAWNILELFGHVCYRLNSIDYDWVIEAWVKSAYVNQAIGGGGVCVAGGAEGQLLVEMVCVGLDMLKDVRGLQ